MSRPLRAVLASTVLIVALAGCGIPDETSVVVHGPPPSPRTATGTESANTPKTRDEAPDRGQFVTNYLAAAAGPIETASDRVREFIAPNSRTAFTPPPEIHVVRLTENPLISPGSEAVKLRVQQLGVLKASGTLEPPTGRGEVTEYTLVVSEAPSPPGGTGGWYVSNPPPVLMLSDVALAEFYQARSIYFWSKDRTALVPDLRYMPDAVPPERQPNEILKWLTGGPSKWLEPAVEALPEDTARIGNVPDVSNGRLQINLTAAALPADDKEALRRLGWQLMWSMRPNLATVLELKIANDVRGTFTGEEFLDANPAYRLADRPERFCVYDGHVRRMTNSDNPSAPVPLLTEEVNRGIRSAALSRAGDTTYAALVVGEGNRQSLLTGAARTGATAEFRTFRLPAGPVGRPIWLMPGRAGGPGSGSGLIAAGGRLLRIQTNGINPQTIELPGATGAVTAVAAAPDGLRIAVVAGRRLYLTVLTDNGNTLQAATVREVRTSLRQLTGVDWTAENSVVVAGVRQDTDRVAIVDSTIDGGVQSPRLNDLGAARVTHLAAYPANPVASSTTTTTASIADAFVAYVANGIAYDLSGVPDPIEPAEVAGVAVEAGEPVILPAAPFFLR